MSWDDGSHAKVNKVRVTYGDYICSVQFTYDGTSLQSQLHGFVGPSLAEFTLESDEYITALTAYGAKLLASHDRRKWNIPDYITSLTFITNKSTYGPYGTGSRFPIYAREITGKQISGFFGSSGDYLYSIYVHYAPIPTGTGTSSGISIGSGLQKLEAKGGMGGTAWDDGSDHDGLTKVYVRFGGEGICYVQFEYVKDGQTKGGAIHGEATRGSTKEIVINHPEEYLVSVEGWFDSSNIILGIQFKTNKKTYENIGYDYGGISPRFNLQVQDKKIIGFHGSSTSYLTSIGAYFVPSSSTIPSLPVKKLQAQGNEAGDLWDDGPHDNVKKIYVGQGPDGVAAVKFEYLNGSQVVFGNQHGKSTKLGLEEFELESDEYITSMEGTYYKIFGTDIAVVTVLIFKTNKNKTAGPFGLKGISRGVDYKITTFKEKGYKIVGFHGRAGESINAIGVYIAPLADTIIPLTPPAIPQPKKLKGVGSNGGSFWDDFVLSVYGVEGVRKVFIGQGQDGIGAVKFVYGKGSRVVEGSEHGKTTLLGFEEFELDYPSEYITEVEGTYDTIFGHDASLITMLRFKTNKRISPPFGLEAGTSFVLKEEGFKIVSPSMEEPVMCFTKLESISFPFHEVLQSAILIVSLFKTVNKLILFGCCVS